MLRLLLFVVAAVGFAAQARAAGCASEADGPPVTDAASWQRYRSWCAACGGTVASTFNSAAAQGGCKFPSGAAGAPAAAGHEMDGHIANAIAGGVTGQISAGGAAGLVGLGILGNVLLAPSGRDPEKAPSLLDEMMTEPEPAVHPARPPAAGGDAWTRGFEHASGCFSQNAGPACANAAPNVYAPMTGRCRSCLAGRRAISMSR